MTVVVRSVGWISGSAETETTLGLLFDGAADFVADLPVRPVRADLAAGFASVPARFARMDRVCRLGLAAARIALDRAGSVAHDPVAVVVESGLATIGTNDEHFRKLRGRGPRAVDPKRFPYTSPNAVAGEIATAFGLRGPNVAIPGGGTGGLVALATAVDLLGAGRCARALVVGVDALSIASAAWLATSGSGIGPTGEAGVAMLLAREGDGARVEGVAESFDPDAARSIVAPDPGLASFGDLPGSAGLLALCRAVQDRRRARVEVRGADGVGVGARVSPTAGP